MHFTAEDAIQRLAPYVRDVSVQVLQVIFFISFYFQWWTVWDVVYEQSIK